MGETPVAQDKPKKVCLVWGQNLPHESPRAAKAPRQAKPAKGQGADGKKNNLPLLLGGLLAVAIAGGAGYMLFLKEEPMPAPPPPPPVAEQQAPAPAPTTDIMPTTNTVNPDEILNAEVPNDPALVKEEIGSFKRHRYPLQRTRQNRRRTADCNGRANHRQSRANCPARSSNQRARKAKGKCWCSTCSTKCRWSNTTACNACSCSVRLRKTKAIL